MLKGLFALFSLLERFIPSRKQSHAKKVLDFLMRAGGRRGPKQ